MRGDLQASEALAAAGSLSAGGGIARVLLVEDSMLIALDAEDALLACGVCKVLIAGNVAAALAEMNEELPDFAVLDYNLGEETSEAVASALADAGVPYCFATGYGDALDRVGSNPPYGVLTKPYSMADLSKVLARVHEDRLAT
jgi:DNA-binding NtrC family response regulator